MTGKELLAKLLLFNEETLSLEILSEGEDGWFYDIKCVELLNVEDGKEVVDEDENPLPPNVIVLRSFF